MSKDTKVADENYNFTIKILNHKQEMFGAKWKLLNILIFQEQTLRNVSSNFALKFLLRERPEVVAIDWFACSLAKPCFHNSDRKSVSTIFQFQFNDIFHVFN